MFIGIGLPISNQSVAGGPSIGITGASVGDNASVGDDIGVLSVANGSGSYTFSITSDPDSKFQINLTLDLSAAEQCSHASFRIDGGSAVTWSTFVQATAATNANPPSHTPAGGSADYLWIAAAAIDGQITASAAPTNYSNLQAQAASGATGASIATAERQRTASSEDPDTFTTGSQEYVTATLAVAP